MGRSSSSVKCGPRCSVVALEFRTGFQFWEVLTLGPLGTMHQITFSRLRVTDIDRNLLSKIMLTKPTSWHGGSIPRHIWGKFCGKRKLLRMLSPKLWVVLRILHSSEVPTALPSYSDDVISSVNRARLSFSESPTHWFGKLYGKMCGKIPFQLKITPEKARK